MLHRFATRIIVACVAPAALLATAAQRQIQSPLSPEAERATFVLSDSNLVVELVAAEPDVRSPVAVAWDVHGRMFVAEMTDYPNGPVSGRIRLLEDRDSNGRFEASTIFARDLAFPNGLMAWNGGLLVTAAPDIWFLADTNRDGVADVRERVLTGFKEGNQQLRVNGLFFGVDNWIYGANGRSDGEVRWADGTDAGSIRRRDFRFRPDQRRFESIAGNSQFGMGADDWGNRFPVYNNLPIRHVVMEERYLERQPLLAGTEVVPSISPELSSRVYALTPPALLIPQPVGFFTSACGPSVYRGTTLGPDYAGDYFVCEPVQNVVQRRKLQPAGASYVAAYASTNREFLASTDPWFHGVFTANGPDGALYIVDMYREWVEHPHWVAPEIRDKVDWRKGEEHGRIWRVRNRNARAARVPSLATLPSKELVQHLASENGWCRDTAHRLLIERRATNVIADLHDMVQKETKPEAQVHALHLLSEFRALSAPLLSTAASNSHPRVREQAVLLAQGVFGAEGTNLASLLAPRCEDPNARVRMQAALALGDVADLERRLDLLSRIAKQDLDEWQTTALLSSCGSRPWQLLERCVTGQTSRIVQARLVERFGAAVAAAGNADDSARFLEWLAAWSNPQSVAALAAFADHPRSTPILAKLKNASAMQALHRQARSLLADQTADALLRAAAVRVLAKAESLEQSLLLPLLTPEEPEMLQVAAARSLLEGKASQVLFDRWPTLSRPVRQQLLTSAIRDTNSAASLLHSIKAGKISIIEVDAMTRQGLQRLSSPALRASAQEILAEAVAPDREAVVERYKASLQLGPDRSRGALVYARNCASCHLMQGFGANIGPDLSGIGTQTRESLLVQILDPSRQVLPDFVAYHAETRDGESHTGFLLHETASTITLRRPNEPDVTLKRADIQTLRTAGKSLMPDGLEAAISLQDMADLIEFLRRPDRSMLDSL